MQDAERKDARAPASGLRALVVAGAIALAGCDNGAEGQAGAAPPPAPPEVTVAHPRAERLVEWTEFTGRFEAIERVEVRARVSGYLNAVDFRDGQIVEKGEVLFLIDPRPFEVAFQRAEADLASAEAQVKLADIEFQRIADLAESPAFSRAAYDQRMQEKEAAQATLAAAQAAMARARLDLEYTRIHAPVSGRISDRRVDIGNLVT
jgi:RND family efflux transporter MFP subunit